MNTPDVPDDPGPPSDAASKTEQTRDTQTTDEQQPRLTQQDVDAYAKGVIDSLKSKRGIYPTTSPEDTREQTPANQEGETTQLNTTPDGQDVGAASEGDTAQTEWHRVTGVANAVDMPSLTQGTKQQDVGDGTRVAVDDVPAGEPRVRACDVKTVVDRFRREGRWFGQLELEKDDMYVLARNQLPKNERQAWVYSELDRLYPPLPKPETTPAPEKTSEQTPENPTMSGSSHANESTDGVIQGLSAVPKSWPLLPDIASLSADIGWVQAQRLRIVSEQAGRATVVHLDRAGTPAPSWSALGWLETSIRSYAKFVDVAARAASTDDGEPAVMRRERVAIDEMCELLNEMRASDQPGSACPHCGQVI